MTSHKCGIRCGYINSSGIPWNAKHALIDPRDDNHAAAAAAARRLALDGGDLYTTNFVTAETHGLIVNRIDRDSAERFLDRLYAGSTHIIRATEGDERRAREIIHQQRDKEYSLVDAIRFAVMERLHLHQAWSYDQHFSQFGVAVVQ